MRAVLPALLATICLLGCRGDSPTDDAPADSFAGSRAGAERDVAGIALCWCRPGAFRMGSPPAEPGRNSDEAQADVTFSRGFWMSKYEVAQGQWTRIVRELPGPRIDGQGDEFPVHCVNYAEAEGFCRKLTETTRAAGALPATWEFRLPAETQWEYAFHSARPRPRAQPAPSTGGSDSARASRIVGGLVTLPNPTHVARRLTGARRRIYFASIPSRRRSSADARSATVPFGCLYQPGSS